MNRSLIYLFLSAMLFFSACSTEEETNVSLGTKNQVLHFGNGTEPQDLDPHTVTGTPERRLNNALSEGLLARNPNTLELEPAVAESWEVSEDGKTYTFKIRKNAMWSNGDPITAEDFVFSWSRLLHPLLGNEYAYVYYPIVNAEAYNKGDIKDFGQVGVRAIDNHTLQFSLNKVTPLLIQSLADNNTFPVHKATIEAHGNLWDRGTAWTRPENFIGNGPFVLREWTPNKVIRVEKNPRYWDSDRILLNGINFYPVENTTTEERMFRTGQLHTTSTIPLEKIAVYKQEQPEVIRTIPVFGTYYYLINTTSPPFDDARVRKALAMTIDRTQIVENITKGGQPPAFSLTPPIPGAYGNVPGIDYDIDRARQLLAEAGYPNGEGFPEFEILYNTMESHRQIALAIRQMWLKALNIKANLVNQEWKVYLDTRNQLNYQVARAGSIGYMADPGDFLDSYTTDSGMNDTGWTNPEFDNLIKRAMRISGTGERYSLFHEAEKILTDEVPLIPIYYVTFNRLVSPDVKNKIENLLDYPYYKDIYLSGESTEN